MAITEAEATEKIQEYISRIDGVVESSSHQCVIDRLQSIKAELQEHLTALNTASGNSDKSAVDSQVHFLQRKSVIYLMDFFVVVCDSRCIKQLQEILET